MKRCTRMNNKTNRFDCVDPRIAHASRPVKQSPPQQSPREPHRALRGRARRHGFRASGSNYRTFRLFY
ncbi:hypothetical protein EMIT0111MI5_30466 [Burkholderia sp. IT-111MI5]